MSKDDIKNILRAYLIQHQQVIFAYLFGSFVNKKQYRDIDIGIYHKSPELLALGQMHTDLVQKTKNDIDLIYLNNLPDKHPAFAYQIVCRGESLFTQHTDRQADYKKQVFLRYFDTAPLRKQMKQAFEKRMDEHKFGKRDYA